MHGTRKFGVSRWIILPAFAEEEATEGSMHRVIYKKKRNIKRDFSIFVQGNRASAIFCIRILTLTECIKIILLEIVSEIS